MSTVKYTIYQMKLDETTMLRKFRSIAEDKINMKLEGYEKTYSGVLKGNFEHTGEILEAVFRKCNCSHPKNYRGHSLSVSDIVQLGSKFFHCQSGGWIKVSVTDRPTLSERGWF